MGEDRSGARAPGVRYGARAPERISNREVEATSNLIWSQAVTVIFETDPDAVAAVLPRPLEPSVSGPASARLRIAVVDLGTGLKPFGAGWFGVRARHGETEGEYALFMPMTTEQATVGGRETFGEPKKIADVELEVDGDSLTARIARMGSSVAELNGVLGDPQPGYEIDKLDFYFKPLPDPGGDGLEGDPAFVYCRRHETARLVRPVSGECKLLEAPLDPIADIPVWKVLSYEYAEIASTQTGEVVDRVPAEWLVPFMHQRYDDLSVLGARR